MILNILIKTKRTIKKPHYQKVQIINCQQLDRIINQNKLKQDYILLEVGSSNQQSQSMIPNSIHVETSEIERQHYRSGRIALTFKNLCLYDKQELTQNMNRIGIEDQHVICYSQSNKHSEIVQATRFIWGLYYLGLRNLSLLDANIDDWAGQGYQVEKKYLQREYKRYDYKFNDDQLMNTERVLKIIDDKNYQLIDIRSKKEYEGQQNDYNYDVKKGRLPNSIWGGWGSSTYQGSFYWGNNNKLRDPIQIDKDWIQMGVDPSKHLVFYCGTGWRSSLGWFISQVLGYRSVYNYEAGLFEYASTHPTAHNNLLH